MKKLIVNADDFGRHLSINAAVSRAFTEGFLRSATVMPGGSAFDDAIAIARKYPGLGLGVHLTLVGEVPVLPADQIPSLVNDRGRLHDDYGAFMKKYFTGQIRLEEVRRELTAQMAKVKQTGVKLTHVDSHQHMHVLPGILEIAIRLAKDNGISAMRIPQIPLGFTGGYSCSPGQLIGRAGLLTLAVLARKKARAAGLRLPDHFSGIVAGECVDEACMGKILQQLQPGVTEIMLHPGEDNLLLQQDCAWKHDFVAELEAVKSKKNLLQLQKQAIEMINFSGI